jgi:hypothetical protein
VKVAHTTCLAAIRYSLSREATDEATRKEILTKGKFKIGTAAHTVDANIKSICESDNTCALTFTL